MASVYHLIASANNFPQELIRENARLELPTKRRHFAAIIIQRCYRGYKDRSMIKHWNAMATIIQKVVRGWLVRWHRADYLQAYLARIQERDLKNNATKIQSYWRGYMVRKHLSKPIKQMVQEKEAIAKRSEVMRELVREKFRKMQEGDLSTSYTEEEKKLLGDECKRWVLFILFKTHHLMRTNCMEGICSQHGKTELSDIEKWMKILPMKKYMSELRKLYNKKYPTEEIIQYIFSDKKLRQFEHLYRTRDRSREVKEVFEIDKNIHDKPFDLYKRPKNKGYEASMLSREEYVDRKKNPIERSFSEISTEFDLFVQQPPVPVPPIPPPYHIDFWDQQCNIHQINK